MPPGLVPGAPARGGRGVVEGEGRRPPLEDRLQPLECRLSVPVAGRGQGTADLEVVVARPAGEQLPLRAVTGFPGRVGGEDPAVAVQDRDAGRQRVEDCPDERGLRRPLLVEGAPLVQSRKKTTSSASRSGWT